jgi:hypothetical protein
MTTLTQVVLVDRTHEIDQTLLHSAALALNSQVMQDLPTCWNGINATVAVAPTLAAVPHGSWPVFLVKRLPPGEGGYHMDKRNQPYAKVIASPGDDTWTIDASHEIVEMLVDPYGNRVQQSQAIEIKGDDVVDATGTFSYLVEACDPCEANDYAYEIGGIAVSDFITPHFYDPSETAGVNYSFRGNIKRPRQLLPGGYISYTLDDGSMQQILWVDPSQPPQYNNLGPASAFSSHGHVRSLREAVHAKMGANLDELKHARRRDPNTLPSGLAARVAAHRQRLGQTDARTTAVEDRYELSRG